MQQSIYNKREVCQNKLDQNLFFNLKRKMQKTIAKTIKRSLFTLIAFTLLAATNASGAGKSIGLRPLKNDIKMNPGQTLTRTITVVNNTKEKIEAHPVLETFFQSDKDGYPTQLKKGDPTNSQDVTNWIDISYDVVIVPPMSTYDVEYSITAPENAEPGGHYGAIIYEPYDPNPAEGIKIQVRVASLLLVNVAGDAVENAEIADFSLNNTKVYDDQPIAFDVEIKNTGNVHFVPEGRIILKNAKGEVLTKVGNIVDEEGQAKVYDYIPVNYKNGHLLPQSSRLFEGTWDSPIFNEKIVAELRVAYSDIKDTLNKTIEFTLNRAMSVRDFNFNLLDRNFTLVLKNDGNVLIKPLGGIKIYNSFDFQVDEISLPEVEGYFKQGEERTFNLSWTKDVPSGRYKAVYEYPSDLDNLKSEPISFIIGNPFMAMLLSLQGLLAVGLLIIIIITTIILIKKKKKNKK